MSKRSQNPEVLILHTELAGYTVACINRLARDPVSITVVHWPVNPEAPFDFEFDRRIDFVPRAQLEIPETIKRLVSLKPQVVLVSGWVDKAYITVARKASRYGATVLCLDNPWRGNARQRIGALLVRMALMQIFSHCWVPGTPQVKFARKLGFAKNRILQGYYSADTARFASCYNPQRQLPGKRKFLFVGRYLRHKGIFDMWNAFIAAMEEARSDCELWCLGTGASWHERSAHPAIKHLGFVQPGELEDYVKACQVFVLPSRQEPWGVVVQEMAAAGMPLLLSDEVGAGSMFLEPGSNGYIHRAADEENLKKSFLKMMNMPDDELKKMGRKSHELSQRNSPEKWVSRLTSLIHD